MAGEDSLHYVADVAELDDGDRVVVDVRERELCVFNLDGSFYALSNFCTHQGGPACEGRLSGRLTESVDGELTYEQDGEFVCCPWHGWEFNIKTGRNLAHPDEHRLPMYETVVRDGEIYVKL